ncbi:MAG: ribosomal protein L7/L12 [Vicinamibacterales bacterium]
MSRPLPEDVRTALGVGNKIEAIRLLREHTGLGLADAKAAVEAGHLASSPNDSEQPEVLPHNVRAALAEGDTITAIRLLREARGVGLKEAKSMLESSLTRSAAQMPGASSRLASGEVPRNGVHLWLLVVVVVAAAALAWYMLGKA